MTILDARTALGFSAILLSSVFLTACSSDGTILFRAPEFVAKLDLAKNEHPEGLAIKDGIAYVGIATLSTVVRVDLENGSASAFGTLPRPVEGKGFMTGLEIADNGDVYAALASFVPEPKAGIYRIPRTGGPATLVASRDGMVFPNDFTFDDRGNLFVTDSAAGAIFRLEKGSNTLTPWVESELLKSQKDYCGAGIDSFDVGANGIVYHQGQLYVTNTTRATIVRVPLANDGAAGTPSPLAGPDCDKLGGADGLALVDDQTLIVTDNRQNKITRVGLDGAPGSIQVIYDKPPLDFPASAVVDGLGPKGSLYITNAAFLSGQTGKPGLLKLSFDLAR